MSHELQSVVGEQQPKGANWASWIVLAASFLALYMFRSQLSTALAPFLYALLLAYLLSPLVSFLETRGLTRTLAIAVVYLFLLVGLALLGTYVIPTIVTQINGLIKQLPDLSTRAQEWLQVLGEHYARIDLPPALLESIEAGLLRLQGSLTDLFSLLGSFVVGLFSSVVVIILVPILAFYMLKDMEKIQQGFLAMVPAKHQQGVVRVATRINTKLGAWVRGQVLVGLVTGGLMFIGMRSVGMDYALVLGLLVAVFNFIPYFGAIIGATPAVVLALLRSPSLALKVLIIQVVVQQVESSVLVPSILGKELGVHPLLIMFAVLLGAQFGGVLGMILAAPITAIVLDLAGLWLYPQVNKSS